jgi:putative endonuclease
MFFVYILQSIKDGSYYIGQTSNLEERMDRHNRGGSKFTKARKPYILVYHAIFETRSEAVRREAEIKGYKGGKSFKELLK